MKRYLAGALFLLVFLGIPLGLIVTAPYVWGDRDRTHGPQAASVLTWPSLEPALGADWHDWDSIETRVVIVGTIAEVDVCDPGGPSSHRLFTVSFEDGRQWHFQGKFPELLKPGLRVQIDHTPQTILHVYVLQPEVAQ